MKHSNREIYLKTVLNQIPRLLGQLDRNPFSQSYGCFDWNYWHDKITGFPNGHMQESMLVLSLLYEIKGTPYYHNNKIKDWTIAALLFWSKIQHKDGTIDEFYVNERQMGATAITLYAAAKTYNTFQNQLSEVQKEKINKAILLSATILGEHDETYVLSNHQSQVLLALYYSGKILKKDFSEQIEQRISRILQNQSEDGWFKEYHGADLGYLTTTISFLAEYYVCSKDSRLLKPLKKAAEFVSYFIYPDGFFGGEIGSRNTAHLWTAGLEILNKVQPKEFSFIPPFCDFALQSMQAKKLLIPEQEDRYFSEQMYDYLSAYNNYKRPRGRQIAKTRFQETDFEKIFKESGIYVSKRNKKYLIINAKKGGVFRIYDIKSETALSSDSGFVGKLSDGSTISSNNPFSTYNITNNTLIINGRFTKVGSAKQSVIKSAGLNLTMFIFGRSMKISNFIKDILIKLLITSKNDSEFNFSRRIDLKTHKITDIITNTGNKQLLNLTIQSEYKNIFVAYSKYFSISELNTKNIIISKQSVNKLNKRKKIVIVRT